MRTKKVNRYYCDHCSKGGQSKAAMLRHEPACIRNPDRSACPFCQAAKVSQAPMPELRKAFEHGDLKALRKAAGDCPACTLAAIVQTRDSTPPDEEGFTGWVEFDYKAEVVVFWKEMQCREPE